MYIELNDNQKLIGREARRFLHKECSLDVVKEACNSENVFDRKLWHKMVPLDWMALNIPKAYGGLDAELTDICVLLEEMGRALLPGPFFSTAILSAPLLAEGGNEKKKTEMLPKMADGKIISTLAIHEALNKNGKDSVKIKNSGDGYVISGTKYLVPYADVADIIFVPVFDENDKGAITILMVETTEKGVECRNLQTIDFSRKFYVVEFNKVKVPYENLIGKEKKGKNLLKYIISKAMVGLSAENIGGAKVAMEQALEYAKTRIQFEKPIGSFQAIKHLCADMKIDIDGTEILTYYAAWANEKRMKDSQAVSLASYVNSTEMYKRVTDIATHIHGALGVTWENDMHMYYKRAWSNSYMFGVDREIKFELTDCIIDLLKNDNL